MTRQLEGKVVQIHPERMNSELVVNLGKEHSVTADSRFLIYRLGEEVKDPDTLESLGNLEIAIGIGKPKHIQDKLTTVVPSEMKRTVQKYEKFVAQLMGVEERTVETPILFDAPKVGDLVRIVQ